MKKVLLIAGGIVAVFLVGYIPQYVNARRLSDELEESTRRYEAELRELEEQNRILGLQRDLGMLLLEVEDQNYGRARERSSRWFDHLAEAVASSSKEETQQALAGFSERRDMLTALLTEANADAATQIRQMYAALSGVTQVE